MHVLDQNSIQARSQEFALEGGCFGGWKQNQTILTQILIGLKSDRVGFSVEIQVISKKKEKVFTQIETGFSLQI